MTTLQTERLKLRNWTLEDLSDAYRIYGDPEVVRWLGSGSPEPSLESQKDSLRFRIAMCNDPEIDLYYFWALERKEDGRCIGSLLLKPIPPENRDIEIGWHLASDCWGEGYATEAAQEVLRYAFETRKLSHVVAVSYPENERSVAVCKRLGFTDVGLTKKYYDVEVRCFTLTAGAAQLTSSD